MTTGPHKVRTQHVHSEHGQTQLGPTRLARMRLVQAELKRAAVRSFAVNERINQMLIERLDPGAWRAKPPGKVRTIAAIFTLMHNVRTKWIRLTAPHLKVPAQLNRAASRAILFYYKPGRRHPGAAFE